MVEWKKLDDCLDFEQPTPYLVKSTEYDDSYDTPVLTAGQSLLLGYTNETNGIYKASKEHPCIIFDDFTTSFHWIDFEFKVKSSAMKMLRPKKDVNFRYIYYSMLGINFIPGGHQRHWISKYSQFEIPIPSLSEQRRIVEQLDTFTSSIENLKEQIAQRRKQYEYYRDQLLDLEGKEGVEMKIEEFCLLKAGKSVSADDISEYYHKNNYPCIGGNGVRGYVPLYSHEGEYPIIGRQGALCGCVNWITGKFYATEHAVVASGYDGINQRFLFYLFENADLNQYKTQGAQPGLSVTKLNEVKFKIPPLQEQQRIVTILDTFESSIQNLEAQLKQREKQYEYYRNKLLTFE